MSLSPSRSDVSAGPIADRIAFVGGLHRSGTTPLTSWLADHPAISRLKNTGVMEDEGQHLQNVYAAAQRHGGPGRFAFDAAARLTDRSELVSADAAQELLRAWSPYWDVSRQILLEKSPPNLIRMRFLRALFPRARFVMIVRHPVAVAMATQKWSRTTIASLVEHWVCAHAHLSADAEAVGAVAVIRYEDLMLAPDATLAGLFRFLGVEPCSASWPANADLNERYISQFDDVARSLAGRLRQGGIRRHEQAVAQFGYSLRDPHALQDPDPQVRALDPSRAC
jgi:hypothetical protein